MGEMTSSPQIVGKIYGPTLVNKMASKCHEFTNKTIPVNGNWSIHIRSCGIPPWISELYKPQCNSKNVKRQLKVYQCKTYKHMDYYHLQVRMKATNERYESWQESYFVMITLQVNDYTDLNSFESSWNMNVNKVHQYFYVIHSPYWWGWINWIIYHFTHWPSVFMCKSQFQSFKVIKSCTCTSVAFSNVSWIQKETCEWHSQMSLYLSIIYLLYFTISCYIQLPPNQCLLEIDGEIVL